MTPMHEPPSRRDTGLNASLYERCHSYARAEKDLIVRQALRAWEGFRHPDATLALDGGTCLTVYHSLLNRFSEDIDMRVILTDELQHAPAERRIAAFHEVSQAFKEHVNEALPFLEKSKKKSRRPRHGRIETHVLLYQGRMPHERVPPGVKLELVQKPNRLPLESVEGLTGRSIQITSTMEISMGKWQAVRERLPGFAVINAPLIRHPWDLGTMTRALTRTAQQPSPALAKMIEKRRDIALTLALRDLHDPDWEKAYADYARRMATRAISDIRPDAEPTWPTLRKRVAGVALDMGLVPIQHRAEVRKMAAGQWSPHQPDQTRGRGRGPSR